MKSAYKSLSAYSKDIGQASYISGNDSYKAGGTSAQLLYIDEHTVSMLCVDGTDGKAGIYRLNPVFDDGIDHAEDCTWESSNHARASVSNGVVSAISAGDVVISCSLNGVTKTASITVFETIPDSNDLMLLPGGCGFESATDNSNDFSFYCVLPVGTLGNIGKVGYRTRFINASGMGQATVFNSENNNATTNPVLLQSAYAYFASLNEPPTTLHVVVFQFPIPIFDIGLNDIDLVIAANNAEINGISYTGNPIDNFNVGLYNQNSLYFQWNKNTVKTTHLGIWDISEPDHSIESAKYFFIAQNFIRYTSIEGRIDAVKIPNIKNPGAADLFNLSIPSYWFGV